LREEGSNAMNRVHFRLSDLADRYKVTKRSIKNMIDDGRLAPPDFYNGRIPNWFSQTIEENERRAAARPSKALKADDAAA
jgi:hypothetical protein